MLPLQLVVFLTVITLTTKYHAMDVFMGRGTPSVRHLGNKLLRQLIIDRSPMYAASNSNAEKDHVARGVVAEVASKNGRFLQKVVSATEAKTLGIPSDIKDAWVLASEETVLVKVKQVGFSGQEPDESLFRIITQAALLTALDSYLETILRGDQTTHPLL